MIWVATALFVHNMIWLLICSIIWLKHFLL